MKPTAFGTTATTNTKNTKKTLFVSLTTAGRNADVVSDRTNPEGVVFFLLSLVFFVSLVPAAVGIMTAASGCRPTMLRTVELYATSDSA